MLWKWRSRQRFNQHCDGLSQTVAIRPKAAPFTITVTVSLYRLRNIPAKNINAAIFGCRTDDDGVFPG